MGFLRIVFLGGQNNIVRKETLRIFNEKKGLIQKSSFLWTNILIANMDTAIPYT